jgi:hypothetical protein
MTTRQLPSWDMVRDLFDYDLSTGILTRVRRQGRRGQIGRVGYLSSDSRYLEICIDKKAIKLHRLIFFYMTGRWPVTVDHINGDGLDNRWLNLREATYSQNNVNCGPRRDGLKGAHFSKREGCWRSSISYSGKRYHLGRFATEQDAHAAYAQKARELHGVFARTYPHPAPSQSRQNPTP